MQPILPHSLRIQCTLAGTNEAATVRKWIPRNVDAQLALPSSSAQDSYNEPIFRVGLPSSAKPSWKHPLSCT